MKKIIKRVSAAVIALAVVLTAVVLGVPKATVASAATASNFNTLKNAVASGGTITITSDITFTDCITVNKTVTIQSQGDHTLKRGSSYTGELFNVTTGGNLTLDGSGNNLTVDGGITWSGSTDSILNRGRTKSGSSTSVPMISIIDNGTVTLTTGVTLQNAYSSASTGSAVGMQDHSTLNINGAVIRNNYASNGGAVKTHDYAVVNMTAGEIYGNESGRHGGAMQIYGQAPLSESTKGEAHFNMSGGKIHNNLSAGVGGAIAVSNCGHLTLSGNAEIYGNKTTDSSKRGGGVGFIDIDTTLNISGNAKIYDNLDSTGKANNLAIGTNSNNKIELGTLSSGAKIGVTYNPGSVNTSSSFAETNSTDYSSCFFSDRDGYFVQYKNQGLYLMKACTTHSWGSGTITTAATCTTKGVKTYTCTVCGATKTEDIAATGHSWGTAWSKDETQHWHVCTKCGALDTKTAHTWNSGTVTTPATCTSAGVKTYTCTACNQTKTEPIAKTEHSYKTEWNKDTNQHWHVCSKCGAADTKSSHTWNSGTVTKAPTCTSAGVKTYTCTACNQTKTEPIEKTEHSYKTEWNKDTNQHWHVCANCGVAGTKTNHTWDSGKVTKAATEYEEGEMLYTCSDCGQTKTESITMLPHTHKWSGEWSADENNHWHQCTECDAKNDTTAHTWDDGEVTTEPTCIKKGIKTYTCSDCKAEKTEEINANGHSLTHVDEVPATEEKEGVKEHWHCDDCGKDFADEDGTQEATADDLRIGKIQKEVQASENVPKPEIATSGEDLINAALTEEDKNEVQQGKDIKIILKVEDATENASDDDKTVVTEELNKLSRYKLGQYLDITLLKQIGEEQQKITTTSALIKITFEIPAALRGKPEYSVIRIHEGVAAVLRDLDSDPNTVTIETDKFSTYALAYKEKTSSGGGSGSSGGGSGTSRPSTSDASDDTSSGTSDDTSSGTSDDTSSSMSNDTSSGTSDNTSSGTSDDTSSGTSDNTSSGTSDDTSSGTSDNTSRGSTSSGDENNHVPSDNGTSDGNDNPVTGVAVSFIPLVVAAASIVITAKRERK